MPESQLFNLKIPDTMELSNSSIPANTPHSINPADVVEQVKLFVGAYGLDKGKEMFESMSAFMSFLPWWDAEVKIPVFVFFKDERERQQLEEHEMELKRARASAPQQPIFISQPQAKQGVAMPFPDGTNVNQMNIMESGANVTYSQLSQT